MPDHLCQGQPMNVLRPVEPAATDADEVLRLAAEVFAGLNDSDLTEVEAVIHGRPDFFGRSMDQMLSDAQ